jgi:hypothetical protein
MYMTKNRDDSSKDPMPPENIAEHEPTAVKRDPGDQEIAQDGKTGANNPDARKI